MRGSFFCFFIMSANVSFAGGNCQLRADRKLCVRLNPRDQREVSAKGCMPHARERTAVTSSARSQRWRRSGEGRRRVHDGRPKKTCVRTVGEQACRSTLWHALKFSPIGAPMLMDAVLGACKLHIFSQQTTHSFLIVIHMQLINRPALD